MKRCVNGCAAPVHPPSEVLCKECFDKLDKKMRALHESEFNRESPMYAHLRSD